MTSLPPSHLGYRMPPEWHPHESTWMAWPKNSITWPDRVPQVQETYVKLFKFLASGERIDLLVDDRESKDRVLERLQETGIPRECVAFHTLPTVDAWIRDYGPNFLIRKTSSGTDLAYNHWEFNAWGNKYGDLKEDTVIPEKLEPVLGISRFIPGMVLEGGSIDVNGEGVCLTTRQCLLNSNRNPHLSQPQIERYLRDYLGVEQVLWLGEGIAGDDTDGHIDDVARFVSPRTIVCAVEEDRADENYKTLQENYQQLLKARDCSGGHFEVIPLPMPGRLETPEGPLPASYANFYIANRVVLVPVFSDPHDERALEILEGVFAGRKVIGIDGRNMVWGLGAIHCLTQQQPALL